MNISNLSQATEMAIQFCIDDSRRFEFMVSTFLARHTGQELTKQQAALETAFQTAKMQTVDDVRVVINEVLK